MIEPLSTISFSFKSDYDKNQDFDIHDMAVQTINEESEKHLKKTLPENIINMFRICAARLNVSSFGDMPSEEKLSKLFPLRDGDYNHWDTTSCRKKIFHWEGFDLPVENLKGKTISISKGNKGSIILFISKYPFSL